MREAYAFFSRRADALVAAALILLQLVCIVFADQIAPYSPVQANPLDSLLPPSIEHPFGTDVSGMDIFSRIVHATRIDLVIAVSAVLVAVLIGVPIGLLVGYYRGWLSALTMRLLDFLQSFPVFVLGMALVSVLGQEIYNVALVLALLFLPVFARLVRAEVLSLVERPFVVAARCSGATDFEIIFRHIMPNAVAPAIVPDIDQHRHDHPADRRLVLHRRRGPHAPAGVGPDGEHRRPADDSRHLVGVPVSGSGHHHLRAQLRPAGRCHEGLVRALDGEDA